MTSRSWRGDDVVMVDDAGAEPERSADETARLLAVAWERAYAYADMVQRIGERLAQLNALPHVERLGEALLLVSAVRNVLRASEFAPDLATGEQHNRLADVLAEFNNALPRAEDARNVLEHFDEYALGEGRLQRRERAAGGDVTMYPVLAIWEDGRCVVVVGPLRIDVPAAAAAAAKLAATVGITDVGDTITSGLRCTHVRLVGGPADGQLHAVDGHRRVPLGEHVTAVVFGAAPADGRYLVRDYEWHFGMTYALAMWVC
jgi:hypothetical protein